MLRDVHNIIFRKIPSIYFSIISGVKLNLTHEIRGRIIIQRRKFWYPDYRNRGTLTIGDSFRCNNLPHTNSVGLIQRCVFNYVARGSQIIIKDNVGISGSTVKASKKVVIGNNVMIGSGCLISDSDSHPLNFMDRRNKEHDKIKAQSIHIGDDVFIGARTIILKGVTIGDRTVVGAGSVVSKSLPPDSVAAGNPCKVLKQL